ncbi:MAG: glucose-1-phosphate adenylyltransferase [Thermoanaerobacteraceae bacterium]|nr:glucose-1-phosphate adenylyltransferase [Thermoanaerobacteraceae bacterium]
MAKKDVVALILAGGQGSRLKSLTKNNAKPAVEFGGKYRIIDFALSNCCNSSIEIVGILTQYQPFILHSHIGIGVPWDLDRANGGVSILPPYVKDAGGNWYNGTADAVFQNAYFVDFYSPDYLIVLSGDHIYKMDYREMLKYHIEKKADATIAVTQVPIGEANRFGILNTSDDYKVYEFEEKPKNPKSNLASMGIYIFNWHKLKHIILEDSKNSKSTHDFGKDIIPNMLNRGFKLYAYPFEGYWRDVGTIESYWEANMDLLKEDLPSINNHKELDLFDENWKIYTSSLAYPPQYIGEDAVIKNSMIVEGCVILGSVTRSVLSYGVYIGKGCEIKNSVIMSGAIIEDDACVTNSIICSKVKIKKGSVIGNSDGLSVVPENKTIEGVYSNG